MMGQYLEGAKELIPRGTMTVISVHECYTQAFRQRASKGDRLAEKTIEKLSEYEFTMYRSVDRILTLTREDMEVLIHFAPALKGRTSVVPHGVDTDFYIPPAEKLWDTKNILFLGNFRHHPNINAVQNFMTHCWGRISKEVPAATFYAIGFAPPPELLSLRSDRITVREGGEHSDVREIYWKNDIFVAPIELGGDSAVRCSRLWLVGFPLSQLALQHSASTL